MLLINKPLINRLLLATAIIPPLLLTSAMASENICSEEKKSTILSPITKDNHTVTLDCHLTLNSDDVITKKILFEGETASNTSLNCNNALIDLTVGIDAGIFSAKTDDTIIIQSVKKADNTWSAPQHINIENCRIKGSIRMSGMGINAKDNHIQVSSFSADHTQRLNEASPRHIMLNNIDIKGISRPLLHLSPGVNHVTLSHGNLHGLSDTVALSLDTETNFNTIKDNHIHVETKQHLMTLNGSANNTIKNNYFTLNDNGGIYLYRHCGQHNNLHGQTTHLNHIEANYFTLKNISNHPSIQMNAIDYQQGYCNDQTPTSVTHTSTITQQDNAMVNTIIYNQFLHASPQEVISLGDSSLAENDQLKEAATVYANINVTEFRTDAVAELKEFECFVNGPVGSEHGGYSGVECDRQCPADKINASIRAACNLDDFMFVGYSGNSDTTNPCYGCSGESLDTHYQREVIDNIQWNHMVIRKEEDCENPEPNTCGSVDPDDLRGLCMIEDVSASEEVSHNHLIPSYVNETTVACYETDGSSGADCIVAGQILCL
ncbi:hypothetical protein [uncultured Shewanella sp.]|uniref:hypothetical protein n=1 Tax=uncultured Shewanella sp. TaxID=173975 RepID=UPI0026165073|nr:hypothetical protein [uncultured Shewanella sp.]